MHRPALKRYVAFEFLTMQNNCFKKECSLFHGIHVKILFEWYEQSKSVKRLRQSELKQNILHAYNLKIKIHRVQVEDNMLFEITIWLQKRSMTNEISIDLTFITKRKHLTFDQANV